MYPENPFGRRGRLLLAALLMGAALTAAADDKPAAPAKAEPPTSAKPVQSEAEAKLAAAKAAAAKAAAAEPKAASTTPPAKDENKTYYTDDKTGMRYTIESVPKVEGTYKWVDASHARFPGGATFEIVDHNDTEFRVKVWERKETPENPKAARPVVDPAKVAESYRFTLPEVDRLTLTDFSKGLPERGQWRNGFDLVDMDKDGNLDLVFGPARKGRAQPSIYLSDGKGNWRRTDNVRFPQEPYDYGDVAVADFNGDGTQDMAFAIHLRGVLVIASDGQGGYQNWSKGIALDRPGGPSVAYSSRAIDVVDWNGDGKPDVIVSGEGPKGLKSATKEGEPMDSSRGIRVFLNQGNGTWEVFQSEDPPNRNPNFTDTFAVGDFNHDQRLDVVAGTRQVGNQDLLGIRQADGSLVFETLPSSRPNALVLSVITEDLDRDGWVDLAMGFQSNERGWRNGVDVFWGGKAGWTRQAIFNRESRSGIGALGAGDLDGDGHLDLVAFSQDSEGFLVLGDGKRGWSAEKTVAELPPIRQGCAASQVTLADLTGDKRAEIIVAFAGEPTGYPGLVEIAGCPEQGSVNVWSPTAKAGE